MSYTSNTKSRHFLDPCLKDIYFRCTNYFQVTYSFPLSTTYVHSQLSAHILLGGGKKPKHNLTSILKFELNDKKI